jgi:hypothetical protein
MDVRKILLAGAVTFALVFLEAGLQMSGLQSLPFAFLLWGISAVVFAWAGIDAIDATGQRAANTGRLWTILRVLQTKDALVFIPGLGLTVIAALIAWVFQVPTPVPQIDPPRLTISNPVFGPVGKEEIWLNYTYTNQGQRQARNPVSHLGMASASGPLTKADEDKMFSVLYDLSGPKKDSGDLLDPGGSRTTSFPGVLNDPKALTRAKIRELQEQKQFLYLFAEVRYYDVVKGQTDEKKWRTDSCQYLDFSLPQDQLASSLPHMCIGHNGVSEAP